MTPKKLEKYNDIVVDIVYDFCKRYYKEVYDEEMEQIDWMHDIDIWEYKGILWDPINMWDYYFPFSDILMTEAYNIPCKIFQKYYDLCLEYDGEPWINLYNYWKKWISQ